MSIDFNNSPYWDDFEATNGALDNNYMRILFRPGYAVQARELTQIQSILQNQIKQFGNHVFKDGSPVIGGHLSLDTSVAYLKLDNQFGGSDIELDNFLGSTILPTNTSASNRKTRARVIQTFSNTTDRTLMIKYLRGNAFQAGQTITTPPPTNFQANIATPDYTGTGSVVTINEGVFYVRGFFVKVPQQTIVLDAYGSTPTYRIGLEIDENIITESEDTALLDPALESFNFQAPGANRYQFNLNLAKRELTSVDDSQFFELLRVENGVITRQVNYPIYSELEKTLARRTYDESGNYVVKPFRVNLSANTPANLPENTDTFLINIEPGKAYIKGFEFETIGTQTISAPRARTFNTNKDHDLSVNYGNFIQLTDITGSAEGIGFSEDLKDIDIHCVTKDQVVLNGNTHVYFATKIGSAKIKNIDYTSLNTYKTNLIDVNFTPMIGEASQNSLYFDQIYLPDYFSSATDAYVDGVITMLSGASAGQSSIITNYNGTSKLAALSTAFISQVAVGDRFSLSVPFSAAESFIRANTTTFTNANVAANVSNQSKDVIGSAFLDDTNFNKNVFKLPAGNDNAYVVYDSDTDVSLYRRLIKRVTFTSNGSFTLGLAGVNEGEFAFGPSTPGTISNEEVRTNLIIVPVSGANAGAILDMTAAGRSVTKQTSQQITINTNNGSGSTFNADIYVTVKLENAESGRRVKALIQANNELTVNDSLATAASVSGYPEVKINSSNGIVWFTTANVISTVPGEKQSLFVSDIVKIKKIYDSGDINIAPNSSNMIDITDSYAFDSGQKDNYYDHGSIILKPGYNPPAGQTAVLFDYYLHSGTGYLSAKSYNQSIYNEEQIPIYKSINGDLFNLRDSIDLRPVRESGISANPFKLIKLSPTVNVASGSTTVVANTSATANILSPPITTGTIVSIGGKYVTVEGVVNTQAFTVSTAFSAAAADSDIYVVEENKDFAETYIQKPLRSFTLSYDYYLPRIDSLVITKSKEFKLINGIPALDPIEPALNEDSIQIYRFVIPPFTASVNSIDAQYIDNRRYTMKDISQIDKKLAELAELVKLKNSEADIINNPPKSPVTPTVNKPIYGTLVDEFDDLSVADTTGDFAASIENGKLTCYKLHSEFALTPVSADSNSDTFQDKFITLPYTEVEAVSQKFATPDAAASVQTSIIGKFEGFVTLSPESDYFYSTVHQPSITDTIGRFFEVIQNRGGIYPGITNALAQNLGSDKYGLRYYIDPVIAGQYRNASTEKRVFIPNPISNLASSGSSLVPVNMNFLGVAPQTFLNKNWTGYTAPFIIGSQQVNAFGSGWKENSSIVAGSGLGTIKETGLYNDE